MANYPKTRKIETTEKIGKWTRNTHVPGSPHTTRYTRWYGTSRANLYHEAGSNEYSYSLTHQDGSYITGKFRAKSLQRALDGGNTLIENDRAEINAIKHDKLSKL
jgi:hypothetical protein